jgi:hypothetical protein
MDLTSFLLPENAGYTQRTIREYAIRFLSDLAKDSRIKPKQWLPLIKLAEQTYYTTFEDSDYNPGTMNFNALNSFTPELRKKILNYMGSHSNYIVQHHIEDYRNQNALRTAA